MSYFVTGATGFIGRNLVEQLLEREGTIYVLVREGSRGRLEELKNRWGADGGPHRPGDRRPLPGEARLRGPDRGAPGQDRPLLPPGGDLRHDRGRREPAGRQRRGNPRRGEAGRGARREALPHGQLDRRGRPLQGHLHRGHVRGGREGRQPPLLPDQARVRGGRPGGVRRCPGASTGPGSSSATPRPARWTRSTAPTTSSSCSSGRATPCPQWFPGVGIEGRKINIVPVDFVAKAMDHIAHIDGFDGQAFHLTDPNPLTAGQVINVFAKAAHAPEAAMRIDSRMFDFIPKQVRNGLTMLPPVKRITRPGARRPRHPALGARLHQLPDRLRLDEDADGAGGDRHLGAAAGAATPTGSGTTGSATSTRTCSRTARSPGRSAARSC